MIGLKYPFFMHWRLHVVAMFAILLYTHDATKLALYMLFFVLMRTFLLYFMAVWYICVWQLSKAWWMVKSTWYLAFMYAPRAPPAPEPVAEPAAAAAAVEVTVRPAVPAVCIVDPRPTEPDHPKLPGCGEIVAIEGNIAVGKTTAAKRLMVCTKSRVHCELVPRHLLEEFQRGNGYPLQMAMGEARRVSLDTSRRTLLERPYSRDVHDRWIFGCRAFAMLNYVLGTLSRADLDAYLVVAGDLRTLLGAKTREPRIHVLFAGTPTAVCKQRLEQRVGPDQDTPLRYLLGVSLLHSLVLSYAIRMRLPCLRVTIYDLSIVTNWQVTSSNCICTALQFVGFYVNRNNFNGVLELSNEELERLNEVRMMLGGMAAMSQKRLDEWQWMEALQDDINNFQE